MTLDTLDRRLLNTIQKGFPLTVRPYAELGQSLGLDSVEVLGRIASLKSEGIIRMIGPVIDARSLGFKSTLAAMSVEKDRLEQVETIISSHPGVSHGYERENKFNLWFTLSVPPAKQVEAELEGLSRSAGHATIISLPALRVFKIGAYFDMEENGQDAGTNYRSRVDNQIIELSKIEKLVLNEIQQDLPLDPTPFNKMAKRMNVGIDPFLNGCRSLLEKGVVRRFSASINHRQAGFTANGMACFVVPAGEVEAVGGKLAALKEVSHCYERRTSQSWPYNIFAMIHGPSKETCQNIVNKLSSENGLTQFALLYSTKEFKKARVKYVL